MKANNLRRELWLKVMERYNTVQEFAKALGCSRQTATSILHGSNLSQEKILEICSLLGIGREEISVYFFPPDVEIVKF